MDLINIRQRFSRHQFRCLLALWCIALLVPGDSFALVGSQAQQAAAGQEAPKIPNDQLDALVAPIALYPDPLLAQTLAASTYPLEIIQLQQWLEKNKGLKDQALVDAVKKQDWDPSIQSMAAFPDVVKLLAGDIKWTTDLGNAFLAQQGDVMDAVQRMRKKAKDKGTLQTTEQQKVETKVIEQKTVIVVEQANPQVVYVPSYNPTVVYGPPVYPYPPIYYPPPPPPGAYVATAAVAFGVGMMVGAAYHGGWGYGCGWGHNDIDINVNNNYNRNANINRNTNVSGGNRNTWQHNGQHRGGAPYANSATANKYGGTARGTSPSARQTTAQGTRGGAQAGATSRGGAQAGTMDRGGAGGAGVSSTSANRGGAQAGTMNRGGAGGGDSIGNRSVSASPTASSRSSSAFGGGSGGMSGSSARASSSRGASSMSSSRGGGGRSGGGGRR
jgi:hypothetical protein